MRSLHHESVDLLRPAPWIDADHPDIVSRAAQIRAAACDDIDAARRAFLFVRDEVRHAGDHRLDPTTCRASDVLRERQGWCYAKAHLLAALLRALGLPAALCYQRLSTSDGRLVLHGLVAVQLPGSGWYRADPRGPVAGRDAGFEPPVERLPFAPSAAGERDLPGLHAAPLDAVVACLTTHRTWDAVASHLQDAPHWP